MLTTVTMRPRRLSTPAISPDESGTRVSRSGMKTSCTREIGRPNSWPSIRTVTYSVTNSLAAVSLSLAVVMQIPSRRLDPLDGRFLERRDQALTVELGDEVVEARLAPAFDRGRGRDRGERDDRDLRRARIGAHRFGELETVHAGHLDVRHDDVERLAGLQQCQRFFGARNRGDVVTGGLEHRGEHVAEERAVVDEQQRLGERFAA